MVPSSSARSGQRAGRPDLSMPNLSVAVGSRSEAAAASPRLGNALPATLGSAVSTGTGVRGRAFNSLYEPSDDDARPTIELTTRGVHSTLQPPAGYHKVSRHSCLVLALQASASATDRTRSEQHSSPPRDICARQQRECGQQRPFCAAGMPPRDASSFDALLAAASLGANSAPVPNVFGAAAAGNDMPLCNPLAPRAAARGMAAKLDIGPAGNAASPGYRVTGGRVTMARMHDIIMHEAAAHDNIANGAKTINHISSPQRRKVVGASSNFRGVTRCGPAYTVRPLVGTSRQKPTYTADKLPFGSSGRHAQGNISAKLHPFAPAHMQMQRSCAPCSSCHIIVPYAEWPRFSALLSTLRGAPCHTVFVKAQTHHIDCEHQADSVVMHVFCAWCRTLSCPY